MSAGYLDGLVIPPDVAGRPRGAYEVLLDTLQRWLHDWDWTYHRNSSGWPYPPQDLGGFVIGRQAVIDLALRVSAVLQLMGASDPRAIQVFAVEREPGRRVIHYLSVRSTPRTLHEKAWHKYLVLRASTVDEWMDEGTVPRDARTFEVLPRCSSRVQRQCARSLLDGFGSSSG